MTTSRSASASQIPDGSVFVPIEPHRLFDSRSGLGLEDGAGQFSADSTTVVSVVGSAVPAGAVGIVMNLTAVNSRGTGYVTVYPADGAGPTPRTSTRSAPDRSPTA